MFFSLFQKDEIYLNLVLDFVPETVYRVARHYSKSKQSIPILYVKVISKCLQLLMLQKDEIYLNLVLDYVPENLHRFARQYSKSKRSIPMIFVKVMK